MIAILSFLFTWNCLGQQLVVVGQVVNWNNSVGGSFGAGSNWNGGTVPNVGQTARFGLGPNPYAVNFDAPVVVGVIRFEDNAVFNLGGHNHSIIGALGLEVLQTNLSNDHQLTLENGTLNSQITNIGSNVVAAKGALTVGSGAFLNSERINLFASASTRLLIENGGQVSTDLLSLARTDVNAAPSNAGIFVDGTGSLLRVHSSATVGDNGLGLIRITDHARMESSGDFSIGDGSVEVTRGTWNHSGGQVRISTTGAPGDGFLLIGDVVNFTDSSLNVGSNGELTLTSAAARLSMTGSEGMSINGLFLILNGGQAVIQRTGVAPAITLNSNGTIALLNGSLVASSLTRQGTLDLQRGTVAIDGGVFDNTGGLLSLGGNGNSDLRFELRNGASTQNLTSLLVGTTNELGVTREFSVMSGSTLNTSAGSNIGQLGSGSVVRVQGVGSRWNSNGAISVGLAEGQLIVENGGVLDMSSNPLATGILGAGSTGLIDVRSGGQIIAGAVELARVANSNSSTTVSGAGSQLNATGLFIGGTLTNAGGTASMNVHDQGNVVVSGLTRIRNTGTLNLNGGTLTTSGLTRDASGTLNLNDGTLRLVGGVLSNSGAALSVAGVGVNDHARLVLDGAVSSAGVAALTIGQSNRLGSVVINSGSTLTTGAVNVNNLGTLEINGGRLLASSFASTGTVRWSSGRVDFASGTLVDGATLTSLLGNGHLLSANQTLGNISGSLTLGGTLNVSGGEIRTSALTNDSTLAIHSGTVQSQGAFANNFGSTVLLTGTSQLSAESIENRGLMRMSNELAIISGNRMTNELGGTLRGSGRVESTLLNEGLIQVFANEYLTLAGSSNENSQNISLSGGTIEIVHQLHNSRDGAIMGRGTLLASSSSPGETGVINEGVLSFSAGTMDIFGDVINGANGRIVTGGGGTTTFFDDVEHNGSEIRTFEGSRTVFFGDQTGAGSFTGTGVVEYASDLRPGNSPGTVSYEGDVLFNSSTQLFIELGGLNADQFDRLLVAGDWALDGDLFVELMSGYTLGANQSYLIGEIGGNRFGQFQGLGEGSLVGSFAGSELFITYTAGNGNDIALYTAVPEPACGLALVLGFTLVSVRRRHRATSSTGKLRVLFG